MKKLLCLTLACILLCTAVPALANGWGLRGGIYDIVTDGDVYASYSADADDGNRYLETAMAHVNHAVLSNRYHSQLITAARQDGRWLPQTVSTKAVYQPGDARGANLSIEHTDWGFELRYGSEVYAFEWSNVYEDYILTSVYFDRDSNYGTSIVYTPNYEEPTTWFYDLWQGGPENSRRPIGDARWEVDAITLSEFNISLLPRSMQDVRQMNSVRNRLACTSGILDTADAPVHPAEKTSRKLAVYSAPSLDSWRAANGKASVSTGGDITTLGALDGWTMISYEVSNRTSRIGFIHEEWDAPELTPCDPQTLLVTVRDTYLTDDPDVSQYPQVQIPTGAKMTGLYAYGKFYAYVAYEVAGQTIWGFVPLRDLRAPGWEQDLAATDASQIADKAYRWDVADLLIGKWDVQSSAQASSKVGEADGSHALPPRLVLYSSGDFHARERKGFANDTYNSGRWRLTDCTADSPFIGRAMYELTLSNDADLIERYGLSLNTDGTLTLLAEDGSVGIYDRNEYSTYGNG